MEIKNTLNEELLDLLIKLKNDGNANNIPNISLENAQLISFLIKTNRFKNALEIGSANGFSSIWIASFLSEEGQLDSIEKSELSINLARENIKKANLENKVMLHHGDALLLLEKMNKKYDFVFIDARKNETLSYWQKVKNMIDNNSLVIVDDVIKFADKMTDFLAEINKDKNYLSCIVKVDDDDGIMLIKKAC